MESPRYMTRDGNVVMLKWEPRPNQSASTKSKEVNDMQLIAMLTIPGSTQVVSSLVKIKLHSGEVIDYQEGKRPLIDNQGNDIIELFESNSSKPMGGSDLRGWGVLTEEQVAILQMNHVFTVEQLASLSDGALDNLGLGFLEAHRRAKRWLDSRAEAEKNDTLLAMQKQIAELQSQLLAATKIADDDEDDSDEEDEQESKPSAKKGRGGKKRKYVRRATIDVVDTAGNPLSPVI